MAPGSSGAVVGAAVENAVLEDFARRMKASTLEMVASVNTLGKDVPTIHDDAGAAKRSATEAGASLTEAQQALENTKANVKEVAKTGKKIEAVASDIKHLYTPEKESGARPASCSVLLALLL